MSKIMMKNKILISLIITSLVFLPTINSISARIVLPPDSVNSTSIRVISPNGGEKWEIGKTYTIKWTGSTDIKAYTIMLLRADGYRGWGLNATLLGPDTREYQWKAGSMEECTGSCTLPPSGDYYIVVYGQRFDDPEGKFSVSDRSDEVFILNNSNMPSINVLSPNGGEQIPTGPNNFQITYRIANFKQLTSPTIRIDLFKNDIILGNRCKTPPCSVSPNSEYWNFSWEVGSYVDSAGNYRKAGPGTDYKIRIILFDSGKEIAADGGDNYFSIISPTPEFIPCLDKPSGWMPSRYSYPEYYNRTNPIHQAVILYRTSKYCGTNEVIKKEVIQLHTPERDYCNYICRNRQYEQCILDGSFDTYYDEWCEDANGNRIIPKAATETKKILPIEPTPIPQPSATPSKIILHRVHRNCPDDSPYEPAMKGKAEQVFEVGASTGYWNFRCANRKQEQCYDDGSFDTYYDEWCEDENGKRITPSYNISSNLMKKYDEIVKEKEIDLKSKMELKELNRETEIFKREIKPAISPAEIEVRIPIEPKKPSVAESGDEITHYYKKEIERISSSENIEEQITKLKSLRTEINGMISQLIRKKKEISSVELKDLVSEIKITPGAIKADQVVIQTTNKKVITNISDEQVSIEPKENEVVIKDKNIEVKTLGVSIVNQVLKVGTQEVKITPSEVVQKAKVKVKSIELKEEANKPVYFVQGTKKARILFAIPITMSIKTKVDAGTGEVISVKKPWWSFLAF